MEDQVPGRRRAASQGNPRSRARLERTAGRARARQAPRSGRGGTRGSPPGARSDISPTSSKRWRLASKPRKRSTLIDYKATLKNHLRPAFEADDLGRLSQQPERFERYAADKLAAGLSPKTVRNHLALLGLMFRHARRWRWVSESPVELVDPPRIEEIEAETLTPAQVASVLKALRTLADAADKGERYWYEAARRMTVLALSTGLRRGELLGLRWADVELLDRRLHVRQSFVLGEMTTPKSRAGRRTLPIGPRAARRSRSSSRRPATGGPTRRVLP